MPHSLWRTGRVRIKNARLEDLLRSWGFPSAARLAWDQFHDHLTDDELMDASREAQRRRHSEPICNAEVPDWLSALPSPGPVAEPPPEDGVEIHLPVAGGLSVEDDEGEYTSWSGSEDVEDNEQQ